MPASAQLPCFLIFLALPAPKISPGFTSLSCYQTPTATGVRAPVFMAWQRLYPLHEYVQGDDPVYVWLPLPAPPSTGPRLTKSHPGRLPEQATASVVPELQLHLRLQWVRQVERGQIMHLDFSLEGCGISVVG